MKLTLIGLLGRKRTGKDTIGIQLVSEYDFKKYSIVSWLRELAQSHDADTLQTMYPFLWLELKHYDLLPHSGKKDDGERWLLQNLAEQFRKEDPFWLVNKMTNTIYHDASKNPQNNLRIVITDVRMGCDVIALRRFAKEWPFGEACFKLFKIERPELENKDNHETEREVDMVRDTWIDSVIHNNGTLEDLSLRVDTCLQTHLPGMFI